MKVSCVCPNCHEEIVINGVKILIDGDTTKSKLKSYIGWGDNNKPKVVAETTAAPQISPKDEGKEFGKVLDAAIKKSNVSPPPPPTPPTSIELNKQIDEVLSGVPNTPQEFDKVVKQPLRTAVTETKTMIVKPPPTMPQSQRTLPPIVLKDQPKKEQSQTIYVDNTKEEARDVLKKIVKQQEQANGVSEQLNKIGEDMHTIADTLRQQAEESKKRGICPVCNKNPGTENKICDECLDTIIRHKARQQHEDQEHKSLIW